MVVGVRDELRVIGGGVLQLLGEAVDIGEALGDGLGEVGLGAVGGDIGEQGVGEDLLGLGDGRVQRGGTAGLPGP